jgi:uncharacterized membrane protein
MKPTLLIIGIVLICLGVLLLAYHGITLTVHEKILDIGPLQATFASRKNIPLSPVAGGVMLAGGIVLVIVGAKKRR